MKNKLLIFKAVTKQLSFTKAAEQLFISQPAISKAIRNLETEYRSTFFIRKRSSIELTTDGKAFLLYVNRLLDIYTEMEDQFINQKNELPTSINFGVSTTIANYVVPKILANIQLQYPNLYFNMKSGNTADVETLIANQELNFGITEGKNTNPRLQYHQFIKDEIVLVCNANNPQFKNGTVDVKMLTEIPMVEREQGSGSREIIYQALKQNRIKKLNGILTLSSTEAIKNYLYHSDAYALISIHAVQEDLVNNKLKIIDIKKFSIERWFYFVSRTAYQSKSMDTFERIFRHNYNF